MFTQTAHKKKDVNHLTEEMTQQTPVKIHLKTVIKQDAESESYELMLFGNFYQKGNAFFLKYDEEVEEGTVHTIVKIADNNAVILRSGAIKMRLSFHMDVEKNGSYESTFGTLLLSTKTEKIEHIKTTKNEGRINLAYDLLMQGSSSGKYEMSINYKEA
ncbi:DUF1934 domain-containing protein [Heyndrickxia sporothermodurans]|nr:DUF1934 family protein [Heyndrickxia sporothermodurans]